ncbi:hypothetical protein F5146DRAFT_995078 [Armillaria mellea]|nr:hypothetical protein F5146DRAFT_995078 [Armillaria mellea]
MAIPYWGFVLLPTPTPLVKKRYCKQQDILIKDRIICPVVVPYWVAQQWLWGILHFWMNKEDREDVLMPINGHEWPVPIPRDTSMDLIQIEMLNLRAEYMWLDVLFETERLAGVVFYLSRLGQPLNSKANDLENDQYWFKCVWILQEMSKDHEVIIGGYTNDKELKEKFEKLLWSLMHQYPISDGTYMLLSIIGIFEEYMYYTAYAVSSGGDCWIKKLSVFKIKLLPFGGGVKFHPKPQLSLCMASLKQNIITPTIAELKKALKLLEDETDQNRKDIKTQLAQKKPVSMEDEEWLDEAGNLVDEVVLIEPCSSS